MTALIFILSFIAIFFSYNVCIAKEKQHNVEVIWYGHATATLYDGTTRILIDPFFSNNPTSPLSWKELPSIDYILLTHDHSDHIGDTLAIAEAYNAQVTGVVETIEELYKKGLSKELILNGIGFNVGGTVQLGSFTVLMIPAVHTSRTGLAVGYFITSSSGFRIYHAGDTAPFGDMKLWSSWYPLDLALLPIGGHFTEDAFLAVKSIEMLMPQFVVPIHYGTFPILASSPHTFKELLEEKQLTTTLLLPERGETLYF